MATISFPKPLLVLVKQPVLVDLKQTTHCVLLQLPVSTNMGLDKQLVMERTGHRNMEGVRSCKRTSNEQLEALSDILNRKTRKIDETLTVTAVRDEVQDEATPFNSISDEQQEDEWDVQNSKTR